MKFKCPECGCKEVPTFVGIYDGLMIKLGIYECPKCHGKGLLKDFEKNNKSKTKIDISRIV